MSYLAQQLSFALWCAIAGCGVSIQLQEEKDFSPQVRALFRFHIYFTVRRLLFELKGIKSKLALSNDPTFSQVNSNYSRASYERLCKEVGITPNVDWRFTLWPESRAGQCIHL